MLFFLHLIYSSIKDFSVVALFKLYKKIYIFEMEMGGEVIPVLLYKTLPPTEG